MKLMNGSRLKVKMASGRNPGGKTRTVEYGQVQWCAFNRG